MAQTAHLSMTPMSCIQWGLSNPWKIVTGIIAGSLMGIAFQLFLYITRPAVPMLAPGVAIHLTKTADGGHFIALHYISARSQYCTRQSSELIVSNDVEWDGRKMNGYYNLAFNQNGPSMYYGTADEYVLYRYLPPDLPKGRWEYITRVRHECTPWGLVHWNYTSAPREIVID